MLGACEVAGVINGDTILLLCGDDFFSIPIVRKNLVTNLLYGPNKY